MLEKEFWIKKKDLKLPLDSWILSPFLKGNAEGRGILDLSEKYWIWFETMKDILAELQRPWLDPRDEWDAPCFKSDVLDIKDLKIWMQLDWVVRNVTDFGAFVDIGLHNDGLVHKSQMANHFVSNPIEVVSVGQKVSVRVLDIDLEREKVSLTMKDWSNMESKTQQDFKKNKKEDAARSRNEDTASSSLKSNITFTKA